MSTTPAPPSRFVRRFDTVWSKMRRVQIGRAVCWTLLVAASGVALLAAADYVFELGRAARADGLAALAVGSLALFGAWAALVLRRWSRPRTAVEIERYFPELGQSVRTAVQYGGREEDEIASEGVVPNLVAALDDHTDLRTRPLPIDAVVPSRRLKAAAVLVGAAVAAVLGLAAVDWEWRVALSRVLLGERPYTEVAVTPGDAVVEEGESLAVAVEVRGRTAGRTVLLARTADDEEADWTERELPADEAIESGRRAVQYEVALESLEAPVEYRVVAGSAESGVYRVDVRYPLRIAKVEIDLAPPEYTGVKPSTVEDGNLHAIEGTRAAFRVELDRPPARAVAVLSEVGRSRDLDVAEVVRLRADDPNYHEFGYEIVPLRIDGTTLSMELDLLEDRNWTIVAEADDGMRLPENRYRIRVRKDQPPQVWFEEPAEALEVHPLAEVLLAVRARDDFGLTKAGIVFQVNNDEEHALLVEDFLAALDEEEGAPPRRTQAALAKVLPLEHFELTQKDSVAYYAFAEDNFPGGPKRAETDLRFIDIRPFRRIYKPGGI
jgi:hypothetical protein